MASKDFRKSQPADKWNDPRFITRLEEQHDLEETYEALAKECQDLGPQHKQA